MKPAAVFNTFGFSRLPPFKISDAQRDSTTRKMRAEGGYYNDWENGCSLVGVAFLAFSCLLSCLKRKRTDGFYEKATVNKKANGSAA
jgi:hypothetical protein